MTVRVLSISIPRAWELSRYFRLIAISLASASMTGCERPGPASASSTAPNAARSQPATPPTGQDFGQLRTRLAAAADDLSLETGDAIVELIEESDAALKSDSKSDSTDESRIWLATLLARIGRPDRAIAHLERLVDPKDAPSNRTASPPQDWPQKSDRAFLALADAFVTIGAFADADRCLRNATYNDIIFDRYSSTQPAKSVDPAFDQALEIRVQCHLSSGELGPASARAELVYVIRRDRDGENAARTRLAKIEHWRQRAILGGHLEAEPALLETIKECERSLGERNAITQLALLVHGECEMRLPGRYAAALAKVEKAALNLIESMPPANCLLRGAVNRTIESLEQRREWSRSQALIQANAARMRPGDVLSLPSLRVECARRLAENYQRRGDLAEARRQVQAALNLAETTPQLGPDMVDAHAATLQTAADIARREKNYKEAHRLIAEAIDLRETRAIDDQSAMLAWAQTTRAWILMNEGDFTTADDEMARITPILRTRLGESDWRTGLARLLLGELRYKQMRLDEAEEDIVYGSRILVGRRGGDEDGVHSLRLCVDYYEMSGNVEMATHYRRLLPESHDHDHDE